MSIDQHPGPGGVAELEGLAPGSLLVEELEGIDPAGLDGPDAVAYLQACARVRNRAAARFLTAVHEAGRAEDGTRTRRALVDEFSGDEVALALGWSRAMAGRWLELADDLHRRLTEVQAALASGDLDEGKARVFSEWTRDLADDHAHHVCAELLPEAPSLPIGALIERIQQVSAALDPEWAARREQAAEKRARVVASRNPSGTANVSGCDLPTTSAVAIMARVEALAAAVCRAGVARRMDWLRAKVYERLLDGFAAGLTDDVLVPLLVADLGALDGDTGDGPDTDGLGGPGDGGSGDDGPGDGGPGAGGPGDGGGPDGGGPDGGGPDGGGSRGPRRGPGGPAPAGARDDEADGPVAAGTPTGDAGCGSVADDTAGDDPFQDSEQADDGAAGEPIVCPLPRLGGVREGTVEVRLRLSTALGLDELPGQVPGWGTVLAGTARQLLERHHAGEWRVVLTDDDGRLRRVLLARRRPRPPGPDRHEARRGRGGEAIVELAAPATSLAALVPDDHDAWAGLLRELQHRLDDHAGGPPDRDATSAEAARRHPRVEIDRWVRVRDRRCVAPGCRRPAHAADLDHTVDHSRGGPSLSWNTGVWCRHHHRAKHEGGWRVSQPAPGRFRITTRAGAHHRVEPPRVVDPLPEPRPAERLRPLPTHEQVDPHDPHDPHDPDEPDASPARRARTGPPRAPARPDGPSFVDPPPF